MRKTTHVRPNFLTLADFYTSLAQGIVANTEFSLQCYSVLQHDEKHPENLWNDDALAKYRSNILYLSQMNLQDALIELL